MKKLLIPILLVMVLAGCNQLNTAFDVMNAITDPTPVHSGEVESIIKSKDKTTIVFKDGNGSYRAESD